MLDANMLANMVREENRKIPDLVLAERTSETAPALPALPPSAAASVGVPVKPTAAHPQGQSDGMPQNGTITSYEVSEMQGMVDALSTEEVVALP